MNDLELLSELLEPTLTVEECRRWASVRREAGEGREGGRRHPCATLHAPSHRFPSEVAAEKCPENPGYFASFETL